MSKPESNSGTRRSQAGAALLFSLTAWLMAVVALFWALGDPPPGPEHDELIRNKLLVSWTLLFGAAGASLAAVILALRGLAAARGRALIALALVLSLLGLAAGLAVRA